MSQDRRSFHIYMTSVFNIVCEMQRDNYSLDFRPVAQ